MIFDHLANAASYLHLGDRFAAGFEYLRSTNFASMEDGRYEIVGNDVFAMVQSYQSKPPTVGRWEAHRLHADIQYIVSGCERMGVAQLAKMDVEVPYDAEGDVGFFTGLGQFIEMTTGDFTIFLPQDVHMPGLLIDVPEPVKKVVVKVRLG